MSVETFVDTNVLLYLLSGDAAKADCAERLLEPTPVVSVQVLNELANVMRRKLGMPWPEVDDFLELVCALCRIEALTHETHLLGRQLAKRHQLSVYDAMIVASALLAGCETLYSEDMHTGLRIDGRLLIVNPFKPAEG
jgi:predicted nucleic acid-binding protein